MHAAAKTRQAFYSIPKRCEDILIAYRLIVMGLDAAVPPAAPVMRSREIARCCMEPRAAHGGRDAMTHHVAWQLFELSKPWAHSCSCITRSGGASIRAPLPTDDSSHLSAHPSQAADSASTLGRTITVLHVHSSTLCTSWGSGSRRCTPSRVPRSAAAQAVGTRACCCGRAALEPGRLIARRTDV